MAEGSRAALEKFLAWCSHGPPGAAVSGMKEEWLQASGQFRDFKIRRD
jgi:acylphosphatase